MATSADTLRGATVGIGTFVSMLTDMRQKRVQQLEELGRKRRPEFLMDALTPNGKGVHDSAAQLGVALRLTVEIRLLDDLIEAGKTSVVAASKLADEFEAKEDHHGAW